MPSPSEAVRVARDARIDVARDARIHVAREARRRRHRAQVHPGRRLAVVTLVALAAFVTAALAAFGPGDAGQITAAAPAQASRLLPSGPPSPQLVALLDTLRIQLPVPQARVTAIGYHAGSEGALDLDAIGTQANQGAFQRLWHALVGGGSGKLRWYRLAGGATSALDVGAAPGTDVYAPVDGVVVGLSPYVVNGRRLGSRLQIQPTNAPSTVVVVSRLAADPALTVGASVLSGSTRIGSVVDFAGVEKQALAQYTNDAGNHVTIEVHPAATLAIS
jgi:hypothetical protein